MAAAGEGLQCLSLLLALPVQACLLTHLKCVERFMAGAWTVRSIFVTLCSLRLLLFV